MSAEVLSAFRHVENVEKEFTNAVTRKCNNAAKNRLVPLEQTCSTLFKDTVESEPKGSELDKTELDKTEFHKTEVDKENRTAQAKEI